MIFAPKAGSCWKLVQFVFWHLSSLKPVSVSALSVPDSVIELFVVAVMARPLGAAGGSAYGDFKIDPR